MSGTEAQDTEGTQDTGLAAANGSAKNAPALPASAPADKADPCPASARVARVTPDVHPPARRRRPSRTFGDAVDAKRAAPPAAPRRVQPRTVEPVGGAMGTIHALMQQQMGRLPADRARTGIALSATELHYLSQNEFVREQVMECVNAMRRDDGCDAMPRRLKVAVSNLPNKSSIFRKLEAHDSCKYEAWVDAALEIPLGIYTPHPLCSSANSMKELLTRTRTAMDEELFGQHAAKDEVIRLVCQWACSGAVKPFAIGLQGPPGIGKTTFAKRVLAKAVGRPFAMIGIGGASDASFLTGHSYTYEGAICGRIVDALREAKCMDPIICIDEVDKISRTSKGDEIVNTLIHLTDREQNMCFRDKYFHGIDVDLSRVIFVFSFNDIRAISPILLDRLNIITLQPPSVEEKVQIARRHLVPRTLSSSSLGDEQLRYSDECIREMITAYTAEAGVRELERTLLRVTSTLNVLIRGGGDCLPMLRAAQLPAEQPIVCGKALLYQLAEPQFARNAPACDSMYA